MSGEGEQQPQQSYLPFPHLQDLDASLNTALTWLCHIPHYKQRGNEMQKYLLPSDVQTWSWEGLVMSYTDLHLKE